MAKNKYNPEQIIRKLREAEILLSKGLTAQQAARKIGICEQTYYRWRKEYGGMRVEQAKTAKRAGEGKQPAQASGSGFIFR